MGLVTVLIAACSGDEEPAEDPLTSTSAAPITTLAESGTASADQSTTTSTTSTTSTTAPELGYPQYSIISREAADNGDIVVVLLDTETYESLSDLDILNVMSDLVEQFAPVIEAHIVETQAAADALFIEEPTEEQQTALDNGYVARLEEGFRIVYLGPLEGNDDLILGS